MGTVPVAPKSNILVSEGDKKVSGFKDRLVVRGLNKSEMIYMPTFAMMSIITN